MPDAVIVATARSPIGRAFKGSLKDVRPAGEPGFNIARAVAVLAGLDECPGVTVNRYCSSSLQTIRMAAHAIKAGEGDVFIAGGVEAVSRFMNGVADGGPPNPKFDSARERT